MEVISVTRSKAVLILKHHGYISWKEFKKVGVALLSSGAKLYVENEKYEVGGYHHSKQDIMNVGVKV